MAEVPLTLETLKSTSNGSSLSLQSPLISPQYLKADDSLSSSNDMETTPERPTNLTFDSTNQHQQKQQEQHSNVIPSSSTTTIYGNISPAVSSAGSLSPSFLPEMPQWKRDLIQRRKQNVQRTISASSPTTTSSTALSSSPTTVALTGGGLKASISSLSVRSLVDSNTNIDQLASDGLQQICSTKDYTKSSFLPFAKTATTTKVNKQHITTTSTNTTKPAINIKSSTTISSPLKDKAEKLFGGQYTATISPSSTTTTTVTTLATKEEITTLQLQQQQPEVLTNKEYKEKIPQGKNKMIEDNEEEHCEMHRKTKEVLNDDTKTTTANITNKQKMATRLTGSAYNNTNNASSSSSSSIQKRAETERGKLLNITQEQHHTTTGANASFVNQSLSKCESERLVCAANTTNTFNTASSNNYNTNNSVTIGGISVSGNISNNQVTSVVKISQKLQENQFIKNEQQLNTKKIIKFKPNTAIGGNISLDLKSPTKISNTLSTSNSTSCLTSSSLASLNSAASATTPTNCAIKKKMVAVQEMKKSTQSSATHLHPISSTCQATNRVNNRGGGGGGGDTDLDTSEDLSYGPGIVSKLRCRYLSLALRESMEQQRLNKDILRRSTSLNNLLDNTEDEENCDEDEEADEIIDEDVENQGFHYKIVREDIQNVASNNVECKKAGILKTSVNNGQEKRYSHNSHGSNGVGVTFTETSFNKRSRHLKRGNDSLKRARSVEALLSEKSPWHTRSNSSAPTCVTIEDKIHNARERLQQGTDHMPPKRLTSIIDDTERPPPDLVKQTLKMFEATANRRPRSTNRSNSKGDVASKVETFKNIIKEQKPVVTFPKPLSPTKKLNTPTLQKTSNKTSTPQANDLLQSPLGRKTMAAATSDNTTNDCLTHSKTNNILSDHTPDIIPRQKFNTEKDFKQNKEIFSSKEKFLSNERNNESPLCKIKRDYTKEKFEVDSPLTALSKELAKMKLNDNTPIRKNDNLSGVSSSDNHEPVNNIASMGGVGGGDNNGADACQRHNNKYPYNNSNNDFINEETTQKEFNNSSLQNENDKIINKTKPNSNNETPNSSPSSTTIATKNEAAVNNYDCSTKASSPPPSSSDLSDVGENYDDDEYGGLKATKRITRTALDNIAKAGYTQQFKFNNTNSSSTATSASNSTSSPLNAGKQIGVIRPLLNTQQQQKSTDINMETLKHSNTTSLTSREIEKNRINDLKKSSPTSTTNAAAATCSSSSASLDHQMIKPSHTSSPTTATDFSDGDTVISATNSPLWAMRKRRQAPPAAPAENSSMVFNFSNRKEVPDYIENDGVVFRRKRELPKPNESGFVLLGDLSVETSTDMDYDDFAMCPPSPCDVEFVNANVVIDGKSSIRQKSKDTSYRVQFNDTLTSTYEYPSEASIIVDESFSAYNESYTQPLGSSSSPDDFLHAFQNINLESTTTHHHVADEIIQLPTLNVNSPAATNATSPTKNILGNLPLDYPDLQKGIQLTTATTTTQTANRTAPITKTEDNEMQQQLAVTGEKKSRKDLKLPVGLQQQHPQKPPLPVKRFLIMNHPHAAGVKPKVLNSINLPKNLKTFDLAKQQNQEISKQDGKQQQEQQQQHHDNDNIANGRRQQRKTPRVLNNPQYACFLQQTPAPHVAQPLQRSRSNEFQKTFNTLSVSATVSRSNSLRNLENVPAHRAPAQQFLQSTATDAANSLCFPPEVNSTDQLNDLFKIETAKDRNAFKNPPISPPTVVNNAIASPPRLESKSFIENKLFNEEPNARTQSLNNLQVNRQSTLGFKDNLTRSVDNLNFRQSSVELTKQEIISQSIDNLNETTNLSEACENRYKTTTENSQSMASLESIKTMASLDRKENNEQANVAASVTADATNETQILQQSGELPISLNEFSKLEKESEKFINSIKPNENSINTQIKCPNKLTLNCANSLDNLNLTENVANKSLESKKALGNFSKLTKSPSQSGDNFCTEIITNKFVNKISLTVNTKYVTDYRSKITANLPSRAVKSMENLTSKNTNTNSLQSSEFLKPSPSRDCSAEDLQKPLNERDKMAVQRKSHDNLLQGCVKFPLKGSAISNENFSNIIEYSLYRNIKCFDPEHNEPESVDEFSKFQNNFNKNFTNISRSADNIVMFDAVKDLTENRSRSVDNMDSTVNSKNSVNNIFTNVTSQIREKPANDSIENFEATTLKTSDNADSITNLNQSLQMSTDSLDKFEDAEEFSKENLLTDLEASEILDDIAIGLKPSFSFDFNKVLLTLRKSKTAYCLQSLEKSNSLDSESHEKSLQSDDNTFVTACNTLESKCPLKPQTISLAKHETFERKPPEVPPKKTKTLRLKTTEKLFNFTNMASQNVATYATFRKSKNFYKNASKSFRNSLRFYETFNEKTSSTTNRSGSLTENPVKNVQLNRKIFSKSSKIMKMKERNPEEWDSPTENSYSFEYFDAEAGANGQLVNMANRTAAANVNLELLDDNLETKKNENSVSSSQEPKQILANDDLSENFKLTNETLSTEKSKNLKPISTEFYFNTTPRPFKRIFQATTIVDMEEASDKPTVSLDTGEYLAEKCGSNLKKSSLNIKPFVVAKDSNNSNTFTQDFLTPEGFPTTACNQSPTRRANSFSTFNPKSISNNSFKKSSSFHKYSKNVCRKVEAFNKSTEQPHVANNFTTKSFNFSKCTKAIENSSNVGNFSAPKVETLECLKFLPTSSSPMADKSYPKVETFKRNVNSTEFSFSLTKFSASSPKFANNSPVAKALSNYSADCSSKVEAVNKSSLSDLPPSACPLNLLCLPKNSVPLVEDFNVKEVPPSTLHSNNSLKLTELDKAHNNFNNTPTTIFAPTTTLATKQLFTTTTATTTTTNFPTKVAALSNSKSSNSSYINSSFSSLRAPNKSYATAKYHQNQKATTIATTTTTTTTTFAPAPPLKKMATINPPKVLPRRLIVNATKTATTKTTTTPTTATCHTTSSTTSSTLFKASTYTPTCTSGNNNNISALRRRVPGNTLYYV